MTLADTLLEKCRNTWLRFRFFLGGERAREKFREELWNQMEADIERLMLETDPDLPQKTKAGAERFAQQIMRHFAYLKTEYGFEVNRCGEFEMGTRTAVLAKGNLEISFNQWREELSVKVKALGGSEVSGLNFLPPDQFGLHGYMNDARSDFFAPQMGYEEHADLRLAKWADVLYPYWPQLFKKAALPPPEQTKRVRVTAEELRQYKTNRAAERAEIAEARRESKEAAAIKEAVGFPSAVRETFHFLETQYDFRFVEDASKPYVARYERRSPLREEEHGVTGVTIRYGSEWRDPSFGLELWLEIRVPSYSPTLTSSFDLETLLKEKHIEFSEQEWAAKTRERLLQVLARMGELFRTHCDEVMRGNLDIVAKAYARPALLAKELALAWARQQAERAWQAKDCREVARLYCWMGDLMTPEEKGRLAEASRLLQVQPPPSRLLDE